MPHTTVRIRSLGELINRLTPDAPDPATGRRRDSGIYRGAGDVRWSLLTSLDRLGGIDPPHTKCALEEHVLRNFVRYSRPFVPSDARNPWELLATAQHHGVPTRLLDWTYSPLVAAHFATLSALTGHGALARASADPMAGRGEDGRFDGADDAEAGDGGCVVWRLDWQRVHRRFGLPEIALLTEDLERVRDPRERAVFTPWDLMARGVAVEPFACLFEPPTLDARIAAQSAVFTLCSDASRPLDAFLAAHELDDALTQFVIAAEDVPAVRDQLDLVTIDDRRLFPDLDGVARQLRRYYS